MPGIWALGDLANHFQLKHMANAETRLVRYNLLHPSQPHRARFPVVPSAVFAGPQVASAGATEQQLKAKGRDYVTATRPYSDTAYGWALEDTTSFVKVLADPATGLLLGAHLIGPQASTLIQPLIQAMCLGNTVDQVASGVLYIHPALTEARRAGTARAGDQRPAQDVCAAPPDRAARRACPMTGRRAGESADSVACGWARRSGVSLLTLACLGGAVRR